MSEAGTAELPEKPPRETFSFRPVFRLRKTDEFSSVFALRRTQRSRHFVIHYGPVNITGADVENGARLGVVVAKRHLKRAHDRNLVKRLAREAFRHARPGLRPLDLVLRLNSRPEGLDRKALRAELDQLFGRMRPPAVVPDAGPSSGKPPVPEPAS
ncbi:ribonuclease P protein component [Methyloversatilis sp.]|uniref:ribonuclease P protein component n=1 Tax=Methyloversatilis sp. TaxID=2569862 RepID=UPI002735A1FB|nr:ribonuclease P protein component [Methyloversatilis sp.]MDP2869540.1 ribonuclease P protein component [Methyloversatilis sp.]MDP3287777.1 ribonuclease P protein component [Methyloversatilis sp.]MDP3456101.1 ribonuclease P protein component [Methyloversatilis sp.]MDP3577354.1 ribonuclease P protein component [Methyloversatilis sp.]